MHTVATEVKAATKLKKLSGRELRKKKAALKKEKAEEKKKTSPQGRAREVLAKYDKNSDGQLCREEVKNMCAPGGRRVWVHAR